MQREKELVRQERRKPYLFGNIEKKRAAITQQARTTALLFIVIVKNYLYSSHALMSMSSRLTRQKALMNADARRALVISGTLRSMAARRIL